MYIRYLLGIKMCLRDALLLSAAGGPLLHALTSLWTHSTIAKNLLRVLYIALAIKQRSRLSTRKQGISIFRSVAQKRHQ